MKDRLLALRGHQEADRRLGLLDAMGDESGGAREDRHGANEARRNLDVAKRRRDRHRDVHRQRFAPDLGRRFGEREGRLDRAPGDATPARQRNHALGARVERLVQGMAVAGERLAFPAMFARDGERGDLERAASVGARQHVFDQSAAKVGCAQDHRAAAEHPGRDRALKRGGIGVQGHARRLHRRGQAMLGERDQAQIKKKALLVGRRPAGREQEDKLGERRRAHEVLGEVASAHRHPVARGRGNRGRCGPRACRSAWPPPPQAPPKLSRASYR